MEGPTKAMRPVPPPGPRRGQGVPVGTDSAKTEQQPSSSSSKPQQQPVPPVPSLPQAGAALPVVNPRHSHKMRLGGFDLLLKEIYKNGTASELSPSNKAAVMAAADASGLSDNSAANKKGGDHGNKSSIGTMKPPSGARAALSNITNQQQSSLLPSNHTKAVPSQQFGSSNQPSPRSKPFIPAAADLADCNDLSALEKYLKENELILQQKKQANDDFAAETRSNTSQRSSNNGTAAAPKGRVPSRGGVPPTAAANNTARYKHRSQSSPAVGSHNIAATTAPATARRQAEKEEPIKAKAAAAAAEAPPRCVSPTTALQQNANQMTPYERKEVMDYKQVYFVGPRAKKILATPGTTNLPNYGYDDNNGDFRLVMDDHIAYRYQVIHHLGKGSFGQVVKCLDHKHNCHVALKVIKNKKKFHEQALVEIKVLKHIMDNDPQGKANVVRMVNHFIFRSHQVIVFEIHGQSLYDVMKAARFTPLPTKNVRAYAKQLIESLVFTYKEKIVHCDMKPENVLVSSAKTNGIKIIDYGSACFQHERLYTYIQSRFYRAPEIILGIPYTPAIDMWSVGCMLAELCNGYPLLPGESEAEQLQLIMQMFGVPPQAMLERAPRKRNFFDSNNAPKLIPNQKNRVHRPNTKQLEPFVKTSSTHLVDLIKKMLVYEPSQRISPTAALQHPFFSEEGEYEGTTTGDRSTRSSSFKLPRV